LRPPGTRRAAVDDGADGVIDAGQPDRQINRDALRQQYATMGPLATAVHAS
jgi:hypothetical protein